MWSLICALRLDIGYWISNGEQLNMSDAVTFKLLLSKLVLKENLSINEAEFALSEILQGRAEDAVIGAFLCLLRAKGD